MKRIATFLIVILSVFILSSSSIAFADNVTDSSTNITIGGDGTVIIISGDDSTVILPGDDTGEDGCICQLALFDSATGAFVVPNVIVKVDGVETVFIRIIFMLDETTGQFRPIWSDQ